MTDVLVQRIVPGQAQLHGGVVVVLPANDVVDPAVAGGVVVAVPAGSPGGIPVLVAGVGGAVVAVVVVMSVVPR